MFEERLVLKSTSDGVPQLLNDDTAVPALFDNGMKECCLALANTLLSSPSMEDLSSDDVLPKLECNMEEMPFQIFQWAAV